MKKKIPCKMWIQKEANQKRINQAKLFSSVMADPNKMRIIMLLDQYNKHGTSKQLSADEYTNLYVTDLSEHLDMSISAVSHSLRQLMLSGFIEKTRVGRQAIYRVTALGQSLLSISEQLS